MTGPASSQESHSGTHDRYSRYCNGDRLYSRFESGSSGKEHLSTKRQRSPSRVRRDRPQTESGHTQGDGGTSGKTPTASGRLPAATATATSDQPTDTFLGEPGIVRTDDNNIITFPPRVQQVSFNTRDPRIVTNTRRDNEAPVGYDPGQENSRPGGGASTLTSDDFVIQEEDTLDPTFRDVLSWISSTFPDVDMRDDTSKPKPQSLLSSVFRGPAAETDIVLPRSAGLTAALVDTDTLIRGQGGRKSGPLKKPRLLPLPTFSGRSYRILGHSRPEPVPLNPEMEMPLNPANRKKLGRSPITFSADDMATFETSVQRILAVASSLDWQLATAAKLTRPADTAEQSTEQARVDRLLQSAGASITQLLKESTTLLGNVILKRRDAVLDLLPAQTTQGDLQALRSSSLLTDYLFEAPLVSSVSKNVEATIRQDTNVKLTQSVARAISARSTRPTQSSSSSSTYKKKQTSSSGKSSPKKKAERQPFRKGYSSSRGRGQKSKAKPSSTTQ